MFSLTRFNETTRSSLFEAVDRDIDTFRSLKKSDQFRSQAILLLSWLNLRIVSENRTSTGSSGSGDDGQQFASFQVAIATNYDTQESYMLLNYNLSRSNLNYFNPNEDYYASDVMDEIEEASKLMNESMNRKRESKKNQLIAFIGYKNLKTNYQYMNPFSNSIHLTNAYNIDQLNQLNQNDPLMIFKQKGNTGKKSIKNQLLVSLKSHLYPNKNHRQDRSLCV